MAGRFAAVLVSAIMLAGCSGYQRPPSTFQALLLEPYRFDSGDRLRITVFGQADLTNSYLVDQAGWISMPLVGGIVARGMTAEELEADIAKKLKAGYIRNPDVSVEVDQYRPFYIMGEVRSAGQYPFVPGMTVQTAIATAGGYTPRALQRFVDVTRPLSGEVVTGRLLPTDAIRPGDTIYVRESIL